MKALDAVLLVLALVCLVLGVVLLSATWTGVPDLGVSAW